MTRSEWIVTMVAAGLATCLVVLRGAVAYSDSFIVVLGYSCPGCGYQVRDCAGLVLDRDDVRDGVVRRCYGVPLGDWKCFKEDGAPQACPPHVNR